MGRYPALTWGRLLCMLVVLLAMVQLFYLFLLSRLDALNQQMRTAKSVRSLEQRQRVEYPLLRHVIASSPVIDTSGQYRIIYDVFKASQQEASRSQTKHHDAILLTHCSINHAHHLKNLSLFWPGPISVAVFVPHMHELVFKSLILLHHCLSNGAQNISLHIVLPLMPYVFNDMSSSPVIPSQYKLCNKLEAFFNSGLLMPSKESMQNYALGSVRYPNNLLRNVARRAADTVQYAFIMTVDIDLIPSPNLHDDFVKFAKNLSSASVTEGILRTAYVIPTFEIDENMHTPRSRQELIELWDQGFVRPFYLEPCSKCQAATNYTAWRNLAKWDDFGAAYSIPWSYPWEPFYITLASSSLPFYDERFQQYGLNRVSQICEMYMAGFQFVVLNNAFLVHLGLKTNEKFYAKKEADKRLNKVLYHQFKEELKVKYPQSDLRC